jgi:hypothetical protein
MTSVQQQHALLGQQHIFASSGRLPFLFYLFFAGSTRGKVTEKR